MANPNIRMIQKIQPGYFVLHVSTDPPAEALEVGAVTPESMSAAIDKLVEAGGVELILDATTDEQSLEKSTVRDA